MSKNTVRLTRNEFETIRDLLKEFPESQSFRVTVDNSSGIGPDITIAVDTIIGDWPGTFEVNITDTSTW